MIPFLFILVCKLQFVHLDKVHFGLTTKSQMFDTAEWRRHFLRIKFLRFVTYYDYIIMDKLLLNYNTSAFP